MDANDPPTIERAIGQHLERLREERRATQSEVATAAQAFGLAWAQPTVAAIENGRRQLTLGELVLLPMILAEVDHRGQLEAGSIVPALWELIPTDGTFRVSPGGHDVPADAVRHAFGGPERTVLQAGSPTVVVTAPPATITGSGGITAPVPTLSGSGAVAVRPLDVTIVTDAERKVARRLKTKPERVANAASALWGHSLDQERDRRINDPAATPQKRGRETRKLLHELRQAIRRKGAK
jgi:hypothetical protein